MVIFHRMQIFDYLSFRVNRLLLLLLLLWATYSRSLAAEESESGLQMIDGLEGEILPRWIGLEGIY